MVSKRSDVMITNPTSVILSVDFETKYAVKRGLDIIFRDSVLDEHVYSKLDPVWHSEYDRLIEFTYSSDGSYMCKKKKKVINKRNPSEHEWISYIWYELPDVDVKPVYNIIKKAFDLSRSIDVEEKRQTYQESKDSSFYVSAKNIRISRDNKLKESDWMFASDVTNIDPVELELWKLYRQKLRDVPQDNSDNPKPLKWTLPLSPDEWRHFNSSVTEEYKLENNYSVESPYLSSPQHYITYKEIVKANAKFE
jgi:hypothetical protein